MTFEKTEFLSTFDQMFTMNAPAHHMLSKDEYWKLSFPNEYSGPCYTYNPPFPSVPGLRVGMYITMKSNRWDPNLLIFLHEENKFFYTENQEVDDVILKPETLEGQKMKHPKALGKAHMIKMG